MTSPDDKVAADRRRLQRSVLINVVGTIGKALWPLFIAITARVHGAGVLGTFLVIQAAVEVAHGLIASGYVDAIHRHTTRRPGDAIPLGFHALIRGSLASVAAVEVLATGVALGIGMVGGAPGEVVAAIALMGTALVLQSGVTVLLAPCTAMMRNEYEVAVKQFLAPALVNVLVLALPVGLVWIAAAFAIAYAICALATLVIAQRTYGLVRLVRDRTRPPPYRRYAILQGLNVGLWTSVYSLDTMLLAMFVAPPLITLYRAGSEITRVLYLVRVQFSGAFSPLAARYLADRETAPLEQMLRRLSTTITWIGAMLAGAIILWREQMLAVALASPPAETWFVVLLLAGQLLLCMTSLTGNTLAMRGMAMLLVKNGLAMTAANIVLNLVLDPWLGLPGAAIATVTAMAVSQALQMFELPRVVGIRHHLAAPLRVLAIGAAAFGVSIVAALPLEGALARIASTGVFGALMLVAMWRARTRS